MSVHQIVSFLPLFYSTCEDEIIISAKASIEIKSIKIDTIFKYFIYMRTYYIFIFWICREQILNKDINTL